MSPPTPTQGPYSTLQDAVVKGRWLASVCDGCCEDCCSCLVPTFCPCLGITQAARAILSEDAATCLGVVSGLLLVCSVISDAVFGLTGIHLDSNYEYDYYWGYYDDDREVRIVYTFAAIAVGCVLLYMVVLACFRSAFRSKLRLPGDCCCDCCVSFFCSCCAVAQMRAHVKRGAAASRDTLPAYRAH